MGRIVPGCEKRSAWPIARPGLPFYRRLCPCGVGRKRIRYGDGGIVRGVLCCCGGRPRFGSPPWPVVDIGGFGLPAVMIEWSLMAYMIAPNATTDPTTRA